MFHYSLHVLSYDGIAYDGEGRSVKVLYSCVEENHFPPVPFAFDNFEQVKIMTSKRRHGRLKFPF